MSKFNTSKEKKDGHQYYGRPGLNHVGAYQVAGIPWVTSSFIIAASGKIGIKTIKFPTVTKKITISTIPNNALPMVIGRPPAAAEDSTDLNNWTRPISIFFGPQPNLTAGAYNVNAGPPQIARHHYYTIGTPTGSVDSTRVEAPNTFTMDIKTDHMHIAVFGGNNAANFLATGSFSVFAELTNISTGSMFPLTGSGIDRAEDLNTPLD
jgi:hypothetical protein